MQGVLGTTDNITSPTFSIVNEYHTAKDKIYHFDFYRLKDQTEALDMGYEEYFYAGAWCFIEWPEKIPDLLPEHYSNISIQVLEAMDRGRSISKIFSFRINPFFLSSSARKTHIHEFREIQRVFGCCQAGHDAAPGVDAGG
jgi:tRNA A37 threonylcarbamoyladenosine biosynthesis protein TsaE